MIPEDKARLRKKIIRIRDSIDLDKKRKKDSEIEKNLFLQDEFKNSRYIMCFASFRSEPNTYIIIQKALNLSKRVILPKVNIEEQKLILYGIKNLNELIPGYMNIPEPDAHQSRIFDANLLDIIIMPGIAFDEKGGRLGFGGGYYDKFIHSIDKKPPLIVIAYDEQIVDKVPVLEHDIRVDKIITDKRVIKVPKVS